MASVPVDTPDYQRGVVNAQKQLYSGNVGPVSVNIGIPPNAESLMVLWQPSRTTLSGPQVTGNTSGFPYPGVPITPRFFTGAKNVWVFDVSAATDTVVSLAAPIGVTATATVYSDAGVHIVADTSKYTGFNGVQYVTPAVPGTTAGDHPVDELQKAATIFNSTTNAQILAPPGAGLRYRLFGISLFATPNWVYVNDNTGVAITGVSANNTTFWSCHPQGLPLATNSAFAVGGAGAGGTTGICTVQYTTETV